MGDELGGNSSFAQGGLINEPAVSSGIGNAERLHQPLEYHSLTS